MKVTIHERPFEIYIEAAKIQARIAELGQELSEKYKDKNPLFMGILNGAFMFTADLVRKFEGECEVHFVRVKSYVGMASSGTVQIKLGPELPVQGRHVVIIEDIVDSGETLSVFLPLLAAQKPASLAVCSLLFKSAALKHPESRPTYYGFDIPNEFVVGYGLDYDEIGRNLPDLYVTTA